MSKTNNELAKDNNTTKRQISKSRKRGWITTIDGKIVSYTAPQHCLSFGTLTGVQKYKGGGLKKWSSKIGGNNGRAK